MTNLTLNQETQLEFACCVSKITESVFFKDTEKDNKWVVSMKEEITTLEKRNTWTVVPLSNGRNVVGYK